MEQIKMTNYKPRHVSKQSVDALNEKIRRLEEEKKQEEEKHALEEAVEPEETESEQAVPAEEEPEEKKYPDHRLLLLGLLMLLLVSSLSLLIVKAMTKEVIPVLDDPGEEETLNLMDPDLREMWLSNKAINDDYVGNIVFDSGLIDLPFVQAKSVYREDGEPYRFFTQDGSLAEDLSSYTGNDVYIWTSWKTGEFDRYEEGGSVFMDYRNYLKDQNIIIYGHHFARDWDPSGSKQFTPLDVLLSEENYEENRYLNLILDNEIRSYVITNVFTVDIEDEYESQIIRTDMNEDFSGNRDPRFFRDFISYMNRISRYDTEELLSDSDRILTLITCLEHQPQYRQIVVCKEIDRTVYEQQ